MLVDEGGVLWFAGGNGGFGGQFLLGVISISLFFMGRGGGFGVY